MPKPKKPASHTSAVPIHIISESSLDMTMCKKLTGRETRTYRFGDADAAIRSGECCVPCRLAYYKAVSAKTPDAAELLSQQLIKTADAWLDAAEHVMTKESETTDMALECVDEALLALASAKEWDGDAGWPEVASDVLTRVLNVRKAIQLWGRGR